MADFKTHLQVSSALGFILSLLFVFWNLIHNFYMAVIIFVATTFGGFLPDIDSDSALPVKIIFTIFGYLAAGLTIYYLYQIQSPLIIRILLPIGIFLGVYQLKIIFMKLTSHRGIFHSIPAFILSFLITLFLVKDLNISNLEKFSLAVAVSLGYLSHLILDEIYSINLFSKPQKKRKIKKFRDLFKVKKSAGTALDLGFNSKTKVPALISYLLIVVLIIILIPTFKEIFRDFRLIK